MQVVSNETSSEEKEIEVSGGADALLDVAPSKNESDDTLQIYEIGYHIAPAVKEEDLEKIVGALRAVIEKEGGSFITEGAPSLTKLAYSISVREGERNVDYDRAYFGWIKFEGRRAIVRALTESLKQNPNYMRFIIWKTVREDTRARMKAPTLREVKRTDTIKSSVRRAPSEESTAPVSEADLEKAIQEITEE
ncbi:MAG: hypothetical protein UY63_C0017G0031 [Parcubacteria group bacterium GW2011_GWA2_51_10]|nr:MAG: hypothetical protein UY63_C0017G0031 [Parcubacteria group bacterium GW2011_GWA2_51_10]